MCVKYCVICIIHSSVLNQFSCENWKVCKNFVGKTTLFTKVRQGILSFESLFPFIIYFLSQCKNWLGDTCINVLFFETSFFVSKTPTNMDLKHNIKGKTNWDFPVLNWTFPVLRKVQLGKSLYSLKLYLIKEHFTKFENSQNFQKFFLKFYLNAENRELSRGNDLKI